MRIRRIAKFVLVAVATLVLLLVLAVALLPWQRVVQQKLIATLEAKGIKPAVLTVEGIGVHGLQLKDVALGTPAVTLQTLSVGYAPLALLQRKTDAEVTLAAAICEHQRQYRGDYAELHDEDHVFRRLCGGCLRCHEGFHDRDRRSMGLHGPRSDGR